METLQPKDFEYYLLPSGNPPSSHIEIHNKAYALWKSVWTKVFEQLGCDNSHLNDDFLRQNAIAILSHQGEPVAVHLYNFLSIEADAARTHSYMQQYPELFFQRLKRMNVEDVMSLEYMTVHPDWRKGKSPVHIGAVLVGLSFLATRYFQKGAAIAPARRDHKVHELAYAFGGEPIMAKVMNHNVECDLLACLPHKIKQHDSTLIQSYVDCLWEKKQVLVDTKPQLAEVVPIRRKIAA